MSVCGVVTAVLYAPMPTTKGFDPNADPDSWPAYISSIRNASETSWFLAARCRDGGPYSPEYWTTGDTSPLGLRKRDMAEMECQICPVQWDCVRYAIDTGDKWNLCAVPPDRRWILRQRPDWRDLVEMGEEAGVSVRDLIDRIEGRP